MAEWHLTVGRLREAVRLSVNATSLRHVARELGLTPHAVANFIDGAHPRISTQAKLRQWYVRSAENTAVDSGTAGAALALLIGGIPDPALRDRVFGNVVEQIAVGYERSGSAPPAWLQELLHEEPARQKPPSP